MRTYPFGERLRELRTQQGVSRQQLADLLGVTYAHVGHLETGARGISVPDAVKLAKFFGLTLDELVPVNDNGEFVVPTEAVA